jgi:hypothetical protein
MVITVRITGYTGLAAPPVVVVGQPQHAEPKGGQKPALRLVK